MTPPDVDVLMITYERPEYVRLSLPRLLDTCDDRTRVWLWHNGEDVETLRVVESLLSHPRVHRFEHSPENVGLRAPTNWLWSNAEGDFVSKVDDDCLQTPGWLERFRQVHADAPDVGVVASWRFYDEDFDEDLAARKLVTLPGGHRMLRNHWVQGSGYLLKRSVVDAVGPIGETESFTSWCLRTARRGAVNGWSFPFVHEEHMDDPRSVHTLYTDDEEFVRRLPLSARTTGVRTVAEWTEQMRTSARLVQAASLDLRDYSGLRARRRGIHRRLRRVISGHGSW